jgi:hypothetical protein
MIDKRKMTTNIKESEKERKNMMEFKTWRQWCILSTLLILWQMTLCHVAQVKILDSWSEALQLMMQVTQIICFACAFLSRNVKQHVFEKYNVLDPGHEDGPTLVEEAESKYQNMCFIIGQRVISPSQTILTIVFLQGMALFLFVLFTHSV